jgi:hypothetical protein
MGQVLTITAWLVLCGSALLVAAAAASNVKLAGIARRRQAGSEIIAMALWPLYLLALPAGIAGAVAGFWLAAQTTSTAVSTVLFLAGGVLAAWTGLSLIGPVRGSVRTLAERREESREVSQDEMIGLIRSRAIRSFARESGSVFIVFENYLTADGKFKSHPRRADPDGFDSYVAAALELAPDFDVNFADLDLPQEGSSGG